MTTTTSRVTGDGLDGSPGVVRLVGELDLASAANLESRLARAIADTSGDVVVDLAGVSFMDASAVGLLVRARTALARAGRGLVLRAPSGSAQRVLRLCAADLQLEEGLPAEPGDETGVGLGA